MNKADVIRIADECELFDGIWKHPELKELRADKFIKFANLAADIEREACANMCEEEMIDEIEDEAYYICKDLALRIRARGQG